MTVKYGAIWGIQSFRARDGILSGPLSFIGLTFFSRFFSAFGSYGEFRRSGVVKV